VPYSCPQKARRKKREAYYQMKTDKLRWEKARKKRAERGHRVWREWRDWIRHTGSIWGCVRCGITDPDILEFHHLDYKKKNFSLHCSASRSDTSKLEELKKGVFVCANCHVKAHMTFGGGRGRRKHG
jgi:hypothetical protein